MKPAHDTFTQFVIDQLQGLGVVEARSMFGGKGLYCGGRIFGLIDEGRLYFRVSEITVQRYTAAGSKPFEPWPGHVMKGYYEVPIRILEDAEAASAWAREAAALPAARPRKASRRKTAGARPKTAKSRPRKQR